MWFSTQAGRKVAIFDEMDSYSPTLLNTVWKLQIFSVTQMLLEIKVGKSRDLKYAILAHLEALNFAF